MTTTNGQLREDLIINATLMACNELKINKKIENVEGVRYSPKGQTWQNRPVTEADLTHVSITQDGEPPRYFMRVNAVASGERGFSASAWVETDAQSRVPTAPRPELRLIFNGFGGEDTNEAARMALQQGNSPMNRQVESVPEFIDATMAALSEHEPQIRVARDVEIIGHSIGAASAMYARLYLEQNSQYRGRYTTDTTLLEPWMESTDQLAREATTQGSVLSNALWGEGQASRLTQSQLRTNMDSETVNVDLTHDGLPYTFVNMFPGTNVGTRAQIERDDVGLPLANDRSIASLLAAQGQHALDSIIPYLRDHPYSVRGLGSGTLPGLPSAYSFRTQFESISAIPLQSTATQSAFLVPETMYRIHPGDGLSHLMQVAGFTSPNDRYSQALFVTELRRLNPDLLVGDAASGYALGVSGVEVRVPSAASVVLGAIGDTPVTQSSNSGQTAALPPNAAFGSSSLFR